MAETVIIRTMTVREAFAEAFARAVDASVLERPVADVEQSAGAGLPVGHYYWPSEFPVAVCGAISTLNALPPPGTVTRATVCPDCERLWLRGNARRNPHGAGGKP